MKLFKSAGEFLKTVFAKLNAFESPELQEIVAQHYSTEAERKAFLEGAHAVKSSTQEELSSLRLALADKKELLLLADSYLSTCSYPFFEEDKDKAEGTVREWWSRLNQLEDNAQKALSSQQANQFVREFGALIYESIFERCRQLHHTQQVLLLGRIHNYVFERHFQTRLRYTAQLIHEAELQITKEGAAEIEKEKVE